MLNCLELPVFLSITKKVLMRKDPKQQDESLEAQQKGQVIWTCPP